MARGFLSWIVSIHTNTHLLSPSSSLTSASPSLSYRSFHTEPFGLVVQSTTSSSSSKYIIMPSPVRSSAAANFVYLVPLSSLSATNSAINVITQFAPIYNRGEAALANRRERRVSK